MPILNQQTAEPQLRPPAAPPKAKAPARPVGRQRLIALATFAIVLTLCFARPLFDLARFSMHSELYSHILLIPFISVYLIWLQRSNLALDSEPSRGWAVLPLLAGVSLLAAYGVAVRYGRNLADADYLALMTLSFLCFVASCSFALLGSRVLRALAFPLAFLIFMVPFPTSIEHGIESFLQHGSAEAAYAFFKLSGMPVFRQGTVFQLPGFSMEVAPQCSGIHSSLVLVITSLLAGHLLLRATWTRALLVLAVIALGMLRNGARIFTLGQLCVRLSPDWINSDLHKRGGPVFFVLSLIPLFLLLLLLRRMERRKGPSHGAVVQPSAVTVKPASTQS